MQIIMWKKCTLLLLHPFRVWVERGAAGVFYINLGTTSFVGAARVIFEQEVSVVWDLKNGFDLQIYMISSDLAF